MSLPFVVCPKCQAKSFSSNTEYWNCPSCGYSERSRTILEENKDYEEQRKKNIENREEELKKWTNKQKKLAEKIIRDCLPNRKLEITFKEPMTTEWGYAIYRENDLIAAQKAQQRYSRLITEGRYLEANWLINNSGLTEYTNEPTKINLSPKTLRTKYSPDTSYGPRGSGFLPTATHEAAHASHEVKHNSLFQPWINSGHDDIWREAAIKFHDEMLIKYGQEIEERFKKLEEIKKEEK